MAELTLRYVVMSMAAEAPFDPHDPEGVFVLKPWKDPAALRALSTYRDNCYPELARELDAWMQTIQSGPILRGDVGRRNEPYAAKASQTRRGAAAKRSRAPSMVRERKRAMKSPARRAKAKRKKRSR